MHTLVLNSTYNPVNPTPAAANFVKNLAAVAASSTRAPIYRTFAKQNNLADITAKGESVANLADVLGTAFGIVLAKQNAAMLPTFAVLSIGYLIASRQEVYAVVLPYLNRARLSYSLSHFFNTGVCGVCVLGGWGVRGGELWQKETENQHLHPHVTPMASSSVLAMALPCTVPLYAPTPPHPLLQVRSPSPLRPTNERRCSPGRTPPPNA